MEKKNDTVWLVDLENTGSRWAKAARLFQPGDTVVMFWSGKSCVPDPKDMRAAEGVDYRFVECSNGTPNAMDFQLTAWLGMASEKSPSCGFVILSSDHGYTPLETFFRKYGRDVTLLDPDAAVEAIAAPAATDRNGTEPAPAKDRPEPEQAQIRTADPTREEYIRRLADIGVGGDDARVMSAVLMQSMRLPQNMRKLDTRNRLTNRYGAKDGNARYNAVKSLVHDIAANGPWPKSHEVKTTVADVNVALGKAGVMLRTGVSQKCLNAVKIAASCPAGKERADSLRKSLSRIFSNKQCEKAFAALSKFVPDT